jgi:hypothetical protein
MSVYALLSALGSPIETESDESAIRHKPSETHKLKTSPDLYIFTKTLPSSNIATTKKAHIYIL